MTSFLLCKMLLMSHFHLKTLLNLSYLLIFTDLPFLNVSPHSSEHRKRFIILIKLWNSNPKQTVKCQRHLFDLHSPVDCTKCTERQMQKQGGNAFQKSLLPNHSKFWAPLWAIQLLQRLEIVSSHERRVITTQTEYQHSWQYFKRMCENYYHLISSWNK